MIYRGVSSRASLLIVLPIVGLIVGLLLWSLYSQRGTMHLMPVLPEPTAVSFIDDQAPISLSFGELNDDPIAYLNQTIVVSGSYLPVDRITCLRYAGPDIRWSLTADNLQLDARGYERVVRLIPEGTAMTVQGIWRLYQGPLGCGKGPPDGTAWYLDVKKILQPNPLVGATGQSNPIIIQDGDPGLPALVPTLDVDVETPIATNDQVTVTAVITETIPPTLEGQATFTATPTPTGMATPTNSPEQSPTPLVPTETVVADTPDPGATMTAAATDEPSNSTPTSTPELPPVPATATEVPGGGYPGPEETLTPTEIPTETPNPYP